VFVAALEFLEFLGAGLDVEFEDVFGAFEFLALLGEGFFGLFALVEFGGDSSGAFFEAFVELGFEVGEFGFNFAAFFDVGAEFKAELLDDCFRRGTGRTGVQATICSRAKGCGGLESGRVSMGTPTSVGCRSSPADSALPEGCGAEDHGGEAEASGGGGECDSPGPCVGVVHECLRTATRTRRPTGVGAGSAGEFVAMGGGGDGGGEFAGFCVEGA